MPLQAQAQLCSVYLASCAVGGRPEACAPFVLRAVPHLISEVRGCSCMVSMFSVSSRGRLRARLSHP
eukprot:13440599-Alexandrium_andersonii.AAC.1